MRSTHRYFEPRLPQMVVVVCAPHAARDPAMSQEIDFISLEEFDQLSAPTTDPRWRSALQILQAGDTCGAADVISTILDNYTFSRLEDGKEVQTIKIDDVVSDMLARRVLASVSNLAVMRRKITKRFMQMLFKAAEAGSAEAAFNAGTLLDQQEQTLHCTQSQARLFNLAIEFADDDLLRASAMVNLAGLHQGGTIGAAPDWERAMVLYEGAAELGLAMGMFNSCNLAILMLNAGRASAASCIAKWAPRFLATIKHPELPRQLDGVIPPMTQMAKFMLARIAMHKGAYHNPDKSLALVQELDPGIKSVKAAHGWIDQRVAMQRFYPLTEPDERSPGNHWAYVLRAVGWRLSKPQPYKDWPLEIMELALDGNTIPFFVTETHFFPHELSESLAGLKERLEAEGFNEYFLAPRLAVNQDREKRFFTPVLLHRKGQTTMTSVNNEMLPAQIIADVSRGEYSFYDPGNGDYSALISIAINTLNQGLSLAGGVDLKAPTWGVRGWNIPTNIATTTYDCF